MFRNFNYKRPFLNKNIMDYCRKLTDKSILELQERQREKNYNKYKLDLILSNYDPDIPSNNNNNNNVVLFLGIISISSLIYFFLKKNN
jgi:23S rRNA pseudoU1915 N3-methylase RlmH